MPFLINKKLLLPFSTRFWWMLFFYLIGKTMPAFYIRFSSMDILQASILSLHWFCLSKVLSDIVYILQLLHHFLMMSQKLSSLQTDVVHFSFFLSAFCFMRLLLAFWLKCESQLFLWVWYRWLIVVIFFFSPQMPVKLPVREDFPIHQFAEIQKAITD